MLGATVGGRSAEILCGYSIGTYQHGADAVVRIVAVRIHTGVILYRI